MLLLDKIKIYNKAETSYIELPRTKEIETAGDMVFNEITMASGKTKMDTKGYRPGFKCTWDWFPNELLSVLLSMLRIGGYFKVIYPAPTGEDATGYFKITPGGQKIFKFVNGSPMWHGLELEFVGQDVVKYD